MSNKLPLSLNQPFRKGQILVGGGWRGFYAPFNSAAAASTFDTSVGPTILDLQTMGPFNESNMPLGWFDLGWIANFKKVPASKIGQVRSGYHGAVHVQYRGEIGETFDFSFREVTRMSYKIATAAEVFNLLDNPGASSSQLGPLSSSGALAVPVGASGYIAAFQPTGYTVNVPTLFVPAGSGAAFPPNSLIVADDDYSGEYGIVGAAGIPVFNGAVDDVDFIRKTSDFVARVKTVIPNALAGQDALVLTKGFVGGGNSATGTPLYAPGPNAKVQKIKGFTSREGGTYIAEWSALFCMDTLNSCQIVIYYPHVSAAQFREFGTWQIENAGTTDMTGYSLDCTMQALAFDDPLDGETVVSYTAYYPAPGLDPQI